MRFLVVLSLFIICSASAQKFEPSQPLRLGVQVNSSAEELSPILSPDGKTLYFARALDSNNMGGQLGGIDIWMSTKDSNGQWQSAVNGSGIWNNKYNNAVIGFNENGSVAYLLNAYDRSNGIAFSKLLNGSWSNPERIPIPGVNQNDIVGCYMNQKFNVLLISMHSKKSFGQEDLFVSLKDSLENWGEPINLGSTINTEGYEMSPFLSRDEKQIYFSSNGHAGYGEADIFMADRLYDSWTVWSKPVNLGDKINSKKFDSYFSIFRDSIGFLTSNRDADLSEIYQVEIKGFGKKIFADSVNRIIKQTQKLLDELKVESKVPIDDPVELIYFESSSSSISPGMKGQLEKLIGKYSVMDIQSIEILSFYRDASSLQANLALFKRRQLSLRDYLVTKGISEKKIVVRSVKEPNEGLSKRNGVEIRLKIGSTE